MVESIVTVGRTLAACDQRCGDNMTDTETQRQRISCVEFTMTTLNLHRAMFTRLRLALDYVYRTISVGKRRFFGRRASPFLLVGVVVNNSCGLILTVFRPSDPRAI